MTMTTSTESDKLKAEAERIKARVKMIEAELQKHRRRLDEIEERQHRLAIIALVAVENAVGMRYRTSHGNTVHLNNAKGTVREIKRTRAVVKWDCDEREWYVPVSNLRPIEADQGMFVSFDG